MSVSVGSSSFSWASISISSPSLQKNSKPSLSLGLFEGQRCELQRLSTDKGKSSQFVYGMLKAKGKLLKRGLILFAASEDQTPNDELNSIASEQEEPFVIAKEISAESGSNFHTEKSDGKPGLISFYGLSYRRQDDVLVSDPPKGQSNFFWFIGPAVLVASLVFPSLYLRRILSTVFEDSLLTDFLILFFTEALFYSGVAIFVLIMDHMHKPRRTVISVSNSLSKAGIGHRISSVATLVLSLIIPLVTMGLVWPWTGPAASATLAPYLVGLIVQFAFEQYARYRKSVAWPVIPVIFQVYRLHQLNRAAQLVTALSFSVRGAETTSQTMAINGSLGTLLNVLHFLGVICIWSLSSFLMRENLQVIWFNHRGLFAKFGLTSPRGPAPSSSLSHSAPSHWLFLSGSSQPSRLPLVALFFSVSVSSQPLAITIFIFFLVSSSCLFLVEA